MDVSNVRTLRLVTSEPIDATASPPTSNPRARRLAVSTASTESSPFSRSCSFFR